MLKERSQYLHLEDTAPQRSPCPHGLPEALDHGGEREVVPAKCSWEQLSPASLTLGGGCCGTVPELAEGTTGACALAWAAPGLPGVSWHLSPLCCPACPAQGPQQRVACSRQPQGGGRAPAKMLPADFFFSGKEPRPAACSFPPWQTDPYSGLVPTPLNGSSSRPIALGDSACPSTSRLQGHTDPG